MDLKTYTTIQIIKNKNLNDLDFKNELKKNKIDIDQDIEIVLNKYYGGFTLNKKIYEKLNIKWDDIGMKFEENRGEPNLIKVIKSLNEKERKDFYIETIRLEDINDYNILNNRGIELLSLKYEDEDDYFDYYDLLSMF
jgi:hypothetical protein